jgi:predicted Fe-Mo cluster-binding NifX family protein
MSSSPGIEAWHGFCMDVFMNVAIPLFKNRVSPRIDIADSLLIYRIDNGVVKGQEKCNLSFEYASQLVSILKKNQIEKIICGGCPQFFLRMLYLYGVEVIPGVIGDPDYIVKQLLSGKLPDILLNEFIGKGCRRRHRQGGRGKFRKTNNNKRNKE